MPDIDPAFADADGPTLKKHAGELYETGDIANAELYLQHAIDKGDLSGEELSKAYYDMGLCRSTQQDPEGAYPNFYQALMASDHYAGELRAYRWFFWAATGGTWPNGVSSAS